MGGGVVLQAGLGSRWEGRQSRQWFHSKECSRLGQQVHGRITGKNVGAGWSSAAGTGSTVVPISANHKCCFKMKINHGVACRNVMVMELLKVATV